MFLIFSSVFFFSGWKWFSTQSSSLNQEIRSSNSLAHVSSSAAQGGVELENEGQLCRSFDTCGASSSQTQSKFFRSRLSPLTNVESRQFLTSDNMTIVCVHPAQETPLEETKVVCVGGRGPSGLCMFLLGYMALYVHPPSVVCYCVSFKTILCFVYFVATQTFQA